MIDRKETEMLDELERLEKAATPGDWRRVKDTRGTYIESPEVELHYPGTRWLDTWPVARVDMTGDAVDEANAALIVAARNALPELLRLARLGLKAVAWDKSGCASHEERELLEASRTYTGETPPGED